jgi:hypothetical protein
MSELRFEERKGDNEKGKGKVKEEEKELLSNRVKWTGIDHWNDEDKKDLADYLKGKGFWRVLTSHHLTLWTICTISILFVVLKWSWGH